MRAAIYRRHGPATEVLEIVELPVPEPGPGEVRVKIQVSGVNPTDWKSRQGRGGGGPVAGFDFLVPNQDGAGAIDAVGPGVDPDRVGERVWLYFAAWQRQFGTAAEFVCLPERQAVPLPDGASYDLGASLGIPALTAHRCLFADGPVEGRPVLVAAGAGAVGHHAIELARHEGAVVVATASSDEKAELAKVAGAHHVVNYRDDDAADQITAAADGRVDRIVEVAPAANLAINRRVLAPNGVISIYAADGDLGSIRDLMFANAVLRFVLVYTMGEQAVDDAVNGTRAALEAKALSELPFHRFSLDEIAAAHDAVEAGAVGKVLVDVN